jgi:hypothetical protein
MVTLNSPIVSTTLLSPTIPITADNNHPALQYVVLYSVYVPNLTANSVVILKAQFQVQGLFEYYVGIGRHVYRTISPTGTNGQHCNADVMSNLQPGFSNEAVVTNAVDFNVPAGDYYYNVIAYAYGSSLLPPNQVLTVAPGSGDITAVVLQKP